MNIFRPLAGRLRLASLASLIVLLCAFSGCENSHSKYRGGVSGTIYGNEPEQTGEIETRSRLESVFIEMEDQKDGSIRTTWSDNSFDDVKNFHFGDVPFGLHKIRTAWISLKASEQLREQESPDCYYSETKFIDVKKDRDNVVDFEMERKWKYKSILVTVAVTDAETSDPVGGARVDLYICMDCKDEEADGTYTHYPTEITELDGIVKLTTETSRIREDGTWCIRLEIFAYGYLNVRHDFELTYSDPFPNVAIELARP